MALFRNDSPGALTFEQAVRKAQWLEELHRRRTAAEAYRRHGRPVPPELEDETPPEDFSKPEEFKRFTNDTLPDHLRVKRALTPQFCRLTVLICPPQQFRRTGHSILIRMVHARGTWSNPTR